MRAGVPRLMAGSEHEAGCLVAISVLSIEKILNIFFTFLRDADGATAHPDP